MATHGFENHAVVHLGEMLPVHGIRQLELPVGDLQEAPTGLVVEAYLAVASCDHQERDLVLQTGPVQLLPGMRAENGASNAATQEARGLHVPEGDRGAELELRVAHPAPGQGREGHLKGDVDGLGGFPSPMVGGQALAIPRSAGSFRSGPRTTPPHAGRESSPGSSTALLP